jgi:Ca2+-binding EF-hand superfamily protein
MKTILLAGVCAALSTAAFSQAAIGGHAKAQFMSSYDADENGSVDAGEFEKVRLAAYARIDANGDGKVNEAEYVGEFEARLAPTPKTEWDAQIKQAHTRFGVLDTDKDATLTFAEYGASGKRIFGELDSNKDGRIDAADSATAYR